MHRCVCCGGVRCTVCLQWHAVMAGVQPAAWLRVGSCLVALPSSDCAQWFVCGGSLGCGDVGNGVRAGGCACTYVHRFPAQSQPRAGNCTHCQRLCCVCAWCLPGCQSAGGCIAGGCYSHMCLGQHCRNSWWLIYRLRVVSGLHSVHSTCGGVRSSMLLQGTPGVPW
jgi:hypothetical protein